jgi:hypothetical protein
MKSTLKEGFALPFAVALIAIFTILFGSIVTTASFYKNQKLIAIKKIELEELALIGLNDLYSGYKSSNPSNPNVNDFLNNQINYSSDTDSNLLASCNFSKNNTVQSQSNSKPTEFLMFQYINNKIESCAISAEPNLILIAKYSLDFIPDPIEIKSFGAER